MTTNNNFITPQPLTPDAIGMSESVWGLIYRVGCGDRQALNRILGLLLFFWDGKPVSLLGLLDGLMGTIRAWKCSGGEIQNA